MGRRPVWKAARQNRAAAGKTVCKCGGPPKNIILQTRAAWPGKDALVMQKFDAVLFDLDGTLLPMELEKFTNTYFGLLAKKAAPFGFQPEPLVAAVWKGTKAMVKNDGTETNDKRFWDTFAGEMGEEVLQLRPVFDGFYANEFHGAKAACGENPLARRAIDGLKAKGYDVILATNPIFPMVGVETRLSWVGLRPEDFSYITAYENSTTCKPNPAYYAEILRNTGKRPQECLMVGNDATEDTAALEQGIGVYLVTDCLLNPKGRDISGVPQGTFAAFLEFAGV